MDIKILSILLHIFKTIFFYKSFFEFDAKKQTTGIEQNVKLNGPWLQYSNTACVTPFPLRVSKLFLILYFMLQQLLGHFLSFTCPTGYL